MARLQRFGGALDRLPAAENGFDDVGSEEGARAMAKRDGLHESEISRILPLAFLAPDIVKAILDGRQPVELTAESLRRLPALPTDWDAQRRLLGFSG